MTHAATMGASSCATMAIGNFKAGQKEVNDAYIANPSKFVEPPTGDSVDQFYGNTVLPTRQDLGRTKDYPFEKLMQDLEKSSLKTKFTIAVLNQGQYLGNDKYWHKQLTKWGFKLFEKTQNSIGSVNYIYSRNPNVVAITKEEASS